MVNKAQTNMKFSLFSSCTTKTTKRTKDDLDDENQYEFPAFSPEMNIKRRDIAIKNIRYTTL